MPEYPVVPSTRLCDALAAALNLDERAALITSIEYTPSEADLARARRRFERWAGQPPFTDPERFDRRLATVGLDRDSFLHLLATPPQLLFAGAGAAASECLEIIAAFDQPSTSPLLELQGFMKGIEPLIARGVARCSASVTNVAARHERVPFDPASVLSHFIPSLLDRLSTIANRTLILELNVARLREELDGSTPEERFRSFTKRIATTTAAVDLLIEYPVLARRLASAVQQWATNTAEILERLCNDWSDIAARFNGGEDPGLLIGIEAEAGDAHRGGRSVHILSFEHQKLVYKPRPLSIDVHFNELLEWLNARGESCSFRTVAVIDRHEYGWVEFIGGGECKSDEEVKRFYERQGGWLALLYALDATDFHHENLIASGEHPVLIDLESLFQHRTKRSDEDKRGLLGAHEAMSNSVMRVGLLPQRLYAVDDHDGIDVSGFAGEGGQLTPFTVLAVDKGSTDEMQMVRKRMPISGSNNRPSIAGREISLLDHGADIATGFTGVYKTLMRHRGELLAAGGVLSGFANDDVRAIRRPTNSYVTTIAESQHPDVLRDALDRDRLFDQMWVRTKIQPELERLTPAEVRDLRRGDVPFFSTKPASADIWTSDGRRIPEFFEMPSIDAVGTRLTQLSDDDLSRQLWFISASMESLSPVGVSRPATTISNEPAMEHDVSKARLHDAARAVADRIEHLAIRRAHTANWIGLTFVGERRWTLLPLTYDLYNGTLGIALFLAYAGEQLGNSRYTELARLALQNLENEVLEMRRTDALKNAKIAIGGYSGPGALVFTLAHTGALWNEARYFELAEIIVEMMPPLIDRDEAIDVIGGSAGALLNVLAYYACTQSGAALDVAMQCGEHILAKAEAMSRGVAWRTSMASEAPLAGFSHGASGIAVALLELSAVSGDDRFRRAAIAAFEYERSVYAPQRRNWPDLRHRDGDRGSSGAPTFMTAWCHGAPGVGLSRVRALRHFDDATIRDEVAVAVDTTIAQGLGQSHSMCHGDLGNLDLLLEASLTLDDEQLRDRTRRATSAVLHTMDEYGWVCGTPQGTETPGLMTGLAGIGYQLLRLAAAKEMPSVLAMAPPAPQSARRARISSPLAVRV
jgi:type 2 lantibiotic biosynthesis protein LanM